MIIQLKGKEAFIKTEFISTMGNHPDFGFFIVVDGINHNNLTKEEYNRIKKIWLGNNCKVDETKGVKHDNLAFKK